MLCMYVIIPILMDQSLQRDSIDPSALETTCACWTPVALRDAAASRHPGHLFQF